MNFFSRITLWISKNPMQRSLYFFVPLAHIFLFMTCWIAPPPPKQIQKKLVVKTFITAPPSTVKAQTVSSKKPVPASTLPKKTPPKIEKKAEKPAEKKILPTPAKKPPVTKKEKTIQVKKEKSVREDLLKELEERIAKIEQKNARITSKPELNVPSHLALNSQALQAPKDLQIAQTSFSRDDFASSLIGYLQSYLHLPELGEVQIQLSLNKEGKVKNMKVTKSESEKNKKYLEEELPKLSFPQIYLDSASSDSFLLTFCNKF